VLRLPSEEIEVGYNFPAVPGGQANTTLELALTIGLGLTCVLFAGRALVGWRRTGSPVGLVLLVGGAAASLVEAIVDIAGLCWYPQEGQLQGYATTQGIPLWIVFAYAAYFGGGTYVLSEYARAGITKRALWITLAGLMASEIVFEVTVINLGGYSYFGNQPITLAGMPLFWLTLNFPGMFAAVALMVRLPHLFTGWRVLVAVFLPGIAYALGAFGAGWPVFSAVHVAGPIVVNLASAVTFALGLWMLSATIPLIAEDGPLGRPDATVSSATESGGQLKSYVG
jgi:hypothetical protein